MKNLIKTFGSMINIRQILIGATVLLVGTLVYLVDRPPDQTYFVYISPFNISLFKTPPSLFGLIGNSLPSLIHVFILSEKMLYHHLCKLVSYRHCFRAGTKIQAMVLNNCPRLVFWDSFFGK